MPRRSNSNESQRSEPNSKSDTGKRPYKKAVNVAETRRKRGDSIRKFKREENLLKKRRGRGVYEKTMQKLPMTVHALASDDIRAKKTAAMRIRKMLSMENNAPIDAVVQSGAVPLLVDILRWGDILKRGDTSRLQFEAGWALINILSGASEHTKVVIDNGALPIFVELLDSSNDNVRDQSVWALGNIVGDSPAYRDLALEVGALRELLTRFKETSKISMLRNAAWTLSNFFRLTPQPEFDQVKSALPALRWLIHMRDHDVLTYVCWALSCLSDGPNSNIQAIIDAGICPKLVELLSHPSPSVVFPALGTVGNIVAGEELQAQAVIDNQAIPRILHLVTAKQKNKAILKDVCWTIANITAGTKEQVQAVIDAGIFPPLLSLLENAEFAIKGEVAFAISNATSIGTQEQIRYLADQGCIGALCDILACREPRIKYECLKGLENILKAGQAEKNAGLTDVNVYAHEIDDGNGLNNIEACRWDEEPRVYEKAVNILDNYLTKKYKEMLTWSDSLQPRVPGSFNFT